MKQDISPGLKGNNSTENNTFVLDDLVASVVSTMDLKLHISSISSSYREIAFLHWQQKGYYKKRSSIGNRQTQMA